MSVNRQPLGRERGCARRGQRVALLALAALALALALPATAPAAKRGFEKLTYEVPVTQPDEFGQPVALDTDVYLPKRRAPRRGFPLVGVFHGGGGEKTSEFDAGHAKKLAKRGYGAVLYSARGHGDSGGQTTVAGPKEVRDGFDVLAWALDIGNRDEPRHPDFELDRRRIGLWGDSQGGLHTNLLQAWSRDRDLNPYRIRFDVLLPANTPDLTLQALIQNDVVKLSFGAGLLQTYFVGAQGNVSPLVDKWAASAAADNPGGGEICEHDEHDTPTSTMKQDLAVRSVGCFLERMRVPFMWTQALDDHLFPGEMATRAWRLVPNDENHLYLDMGGHAAPTTSRRVERAELRARLRYLDHYLRGRPLDAPRVTYWTRDTEVGVPAGSYRYPDGAWERHTTRRWPPPKTRNVRYELSADGRAPREGASAGELPLAPAASDPANDPVAHAAFSATPVGTSPLRALPAAEAPGTVASFETEPFRRERELSGQARVRVGWEPASRASQLVFKLLDRAPDGTLTLLGRGVVGVQDGTPGEAEEIDVFANQFSARIPEGHSLVTWLTASDANFYKPYPGMAGGVLGVGPDATLRLPLKRPSR